MVISIEMVLKAKSVQWGLNREKRGGDLGNPNSNGKRRISVPRLLANVSGV